MLVVAMNYVKVTGFVVFEIILTWVLVSKVFMPYFPRLTTDKAKCILFLAGTTMLLVAGIGRLGWDIQTWDGNTAREKLDFYVFMLLSLGGTFLLLLDFFITRYAK